MKTLSQRERLMLAGLFLSKFDRDGLKCLGFSNFSEAFNAIGYALGGKPASIKNYMQEFDPLFPNSRKGWHKRQMREHCRDAFERFGKLSIQEFFRLLSPLLLSSVKPLPDGMDELAVLDEENLENESFSKRLITGAAAEGFFESSFPKIANFTGHVLTNVTRFGCGFDFRVQPSDSRPFLAVEVKGLAEASGEILMTRKEHQVAKYLQDRYFLCIVKNFAESPILTLFQNPLENGLQFTPRERKQTTLTWHARIPA
jgi:hypothetical protein